MRRGRQLTPLSVTSEERESLERWTGDQRRAKRWPNERASFWRPPPEKVIPR